MKDQRRTGHLTTSFAPLKLLVVFRGCRWQQHKDIKALGVLKAVPMHQRQYQALGDLGARLPLLLLQVTRL